MSESVKRPPKEKVDLYDRLIGSHPQIQRRGFTMPYTSVNGHLFSILSESGTMGLRLPKETQDAFLEKYGTTLFESHGTVMKAFVTVPDVLLENTEELFAYLDISYQYVKSLKPKLTRRKS